MLPSRSSSAATNSFTAANSREHLFHGQAAVRIRVHFRETAIELLPLPIGKRERIRDARNACPDRLAIVASANRRAPFRASALDAWVNGADVCS